MLTDGCHIHIKRATDLYEVQSFSNKNRYHVLPCVEAKKKIAETIKTEGWQTMVCVCRGRDKGVGGKPPKLNFQTVKHKPS